MEHLFDVVVRLEPEACLGVTCGHWVNEIDGYRNGYKPNIVSIPLGSLHFRASKISVSVETPLYANTLELGQWSSEALKNVAAECYGAYLRSGH